MKRPSAGGLNATSSPLVVQRKTGTVTPPRSSLRTNRNARSPSINAQRPDNATSNASPSVCGRGSVARRPIRYSGLRGDCRPRPILRPSDRGAADEIAHRGRQGEPGNRTVGGPVVRPHADNLHAAAGRRRASEDDGRHRVELFGAGGRAFRAEVVQARPVDRRPRSAAVLIWPAPPFVPVSASAAAASASASSSGVRPAPSANA